MLTLFILTKIFQTFRKCFLLLLLIYCQNLHAGLFDGTGFYSDKQISDRGEISISSYIGGALVGTLPTLWLIGSHTSDLCKIDIVGFALPEFGVGQLIQGRYLETGWIVTGGEGLTLGLLLSEYYGSGGDSEAALALGYLAFRCYEIYDLWFGSPKHNKAVRKLVLSFAPIGKMGAIGAVNIKF